MNGRTGSWVNDALLKGAPGLLGFLFLSLKHSSPDPQTRGPAETPTKWLEGLGHTADLEVRTAGAHVHRPLKRVHLRTLLSSR